MVHDDALRHYWMPFTANRAFRREPRTIVAARGVHYYLDDGHKLLDGTGGLWCCNIGHGDTRISEAIGRAAATLDYSPPFGFVHPDALALARRLVGMAPPSFSEAFFTTSGSDAVETALKMALAYHRARGEGTRTRLIGRELSYHGVGFGGLSVSGLAANRRAFGPLLGGADHLRGTYDIAENRFTRGQPPFGAERAHDLERLIALHDASTIAAVIVEPVVGALGVFPPPEGYLEALRAICNAHGILLIFDEVVTAFGRLGAAFAAERFHVEPDLIVLAKGLTAGTAPMGAVLCRTGIFDAIADATPDGDIELRHGYTYSAHPLSCAAALASLDIYEEDRLFDRALQLEPLFADVLHALHDVQGVIDIRTIGLMGAIAFASGGPTGARGAMIARHCFEQGVLVRAANDTIMVSPPLVVQPDQIEIIAQAIRAGAIASAPPAKERSA